MYLLEIQLIGIFPLILQLAFGLIIMGLLVIILLLETQIKLLAQMDG
ncbi:MAG: hypothetical protein BWY74_02719 [Firmicutes bacterium ADurb.Bin419]|nr:MAG: hypothetical protein BWY74_02719 [Firmicutes bacterium ADurb.Bin419]